MEYEPALQGVHVEAPAMEMLPGVQAAQLEADPIEPEAKPALHLVHVKEPGDE